MKVIFAAALQGTRKRNAGVLAGAAFAMVLTSSAAFAQCAATNQTGATATINNVGSLAIPTSATSAVALGCHRQRQHRLPHPAGQRLRVRASQSDAGTAGRWRLGARRRRPGQYQFHVGLHGRYDPARRHHQYGDDELQQFPARELCGRSGRRRHRDAQLERLESPSRDHRRLSRSQRPPTTPVSGTPSTSRSSAPTSSRPRAASLPT